MKLEGIVAGGLLMLLAVSSACSVAKVHNTHSTTSIDSIDRMLQDFASATYAQDIQKAEALFLPPDETADGKNRQQHIREIRKDWASGEHKEKLIIEFKKRQVLVRNEETFVRTEMSVPGYGPDMLLEFKVVFINNDCRIAAMEYLEE